MAMVALGSNLALGALVRSHACRSLSEPPVVYFHGPQSQFWLLEMRHKASDPAMLKEE